MLSGGDIRLYDDRSASLVVNDEFYSSNIDGDEFTVYFDGADYDTNTIFISNVKFTGSSLTATVTSTYTTDVNLEVDLSATYDYYVRGTDQTQTEYELNVYDFQYFTLSKGKSSWQITLNFRYSEGGGIGNDATSIDNIRWDFGGNNGSGNGTVMGQYRYYFSNEQGKLK